MADKQRSTSRRSPEENQNLDNERNPGQNNRNDMSRDVGLQTGGIDHTDRNTSDQSGQSPEVTGPSNVNVFNTEGPVQQGAGATIIQNPTYHNCNNQQHHHHHHHHYNPPSHITSTDQYLQWMEQVKAAALGPSSTLPGLPPCPESRLAGEEDRAGQSQTHRKTPVYPSQHGNSSSYHVPCHCQDCMVYHQRQHPPLAALSGLESESRHSGQTHHQPVPQLLPTPQNTEQKDSTKKGKQHQANPRKRKVCQRSSRTPQPSSSDVRPNVTCTERSDERGQTAKTVRSTHETRPVNNDGIPDSVCIMDSRGQSLEPGDGVWFDRDGNKRCGIYVGGQDIVWSEKTDRLLVHKGELKLTDPFGKLPVYNGGGVRVFPPEERVDRAKSRVGSRFMEGDMGDGLDFPVWIHTEMGWGQAASRGFGLWNLY